MPAFVRNKTFVSVVALLLLGAAVGTAQKQAMGSGKPFVASDVGRTVLIPVNLAFDRVFAAGDWLLRFARPRSLILRENASLRREVRRLTEENARLREAAEENVRLRKALRLREQIRLQMIPAEVVSRKGSGWFETAILDRGRRSGVVKGSAVVSFRGLVGQIEQADPYTSLVIGLGDENSAVGGTVQRSRVSGIVQGQGEDDLLLNYLPKDADVRKGDIVVSSGMGRVIPKGFPIGRVMRVLRNSIGGTTSALVRPSARLDQVEQVFIVPPGQGGVQL
jgi:rod shape-determining protein MreC